MEAQSLSTCNQCGKKFQRKAHLLRHQQQHSGDRPYSCKFCAKTFKRSDVLRDHFSRCERRGSSAIPSSLERGRKRHACDECSRLKVKCDNNVPCGKCVEFGRKCAKSRSAAASSPEGSVSSSMTPDPNSDRNSIGFLLNLPGETDFMQEFPKSSTMSPHQPAMMDAERRYEPHVGRVPSSTVFQEYGHMVHENNLDVFLSHLEFQTFEEQTNNWQMPDEDIILWSERDAIFLDRPVLDQMAFDIREKLKYTAATMNPPHLPSNELLGAIEIMTADNIAAYIKLYFGHWHKHAPMVHEATFNPCGAALPLVLALMSLGGMYSKEIEDVKKLKLLLDTIEEYIFSIPALNNEYELPGREYRRQREDSSSDWLQHQLEELQGAYLMIVLQFWTGNKIARTRVRQQRFTRYVAIFHHWEFGTVQHSTNFPITDQQAFRSWIRKESMIRTACFSIMLDHAFGIFNNIPPRFQWSELDILFPGDDDFFTTTNFAEMITKSVSPRPKMKIKEAFLLLFSGPATAEDDINTLRLNGITALDMQMLMHFMYTHLWAATFQNPLASLPGTNIQVLLAPFKQAMLNWRIIWDEIKNSAVETEWNKLGFQRTAETYYDAVKAVMGVFEKMGGKVPVCPGDCETSMHLKRLLSFA